MAGTYVVPDQYAGKNLNYLASQGGGSVDTLGALLGVGRDTPLTAGQKITVSDLPGISPNSTELQFINKSFTPYAQYQTDQTTKFNEQQKAEEQNFMDALNAKVAGQETLTNASERIGGELNLPDLRKSAQDLTATLAAIPERVTESSQNFGLSAGQMQGRTATEQSRLAPQAQKAATLQQNAEQELGNRLGLLVADQSAELKPFYQAQLPLLQDRLAREQTNYTQDKQNELEMILTKLNQGFQATQNELDRANALATAEMGYKNSLEQIRLSTDEAIRQSAAIKAQNNSGGGNKALSYLNSSARITGLTGSTFQADDNGFGTFNVDPSLYTLSQ